MNNLLPYTIEKGHHRSGVFFSLRLMDVNTDYDFSFDENCWFELKEEDDYDINKLCGFSYGLHHNDSIRLGWRPSAEKSKIDLFTYYYNNGKRDFKFLCTIHTDRIHNATIELLNDSFLVSVRDSLGKNVGVGSVPFEFPKLKLGYFLFPYFGGNKTAPNDMNIWLRRNHVSANTINQPLSLAF